ncbi:MAG TPA: hypothetical protein VFL82_01620 [Thermomicrobiales bacterium]|nr:hypothetical protein [Thermomicrobiales bacterium]
MLQAGASVVTITPPLGSPMAGLFHYREAKTVADDLTARALVLDNGEAQLALVVCDLISLRAETVADARARIEQRCGIPGAQVMIACTHTHMGPPTSGHFNMKANPDYLDWVAGRIADSVAIACARRVPSRVASGTADTSGICFNRRYHMRDGTVRFNPGLGNPDIIKPAGPTDPQVTAFLVEDDQSNPLALWACLSSHYAGTDDEEALSADFYGDFARAIARSLGPDCIGLLANGTSGNINTIDVNQALKVKGTARARLIGETVAGAAIQAVLMQPRNDDPCLESTVLPLTVTRRQITDDDIALARAIVDAPEDTEPEPVSGFSFVVGQPIPASLARTYAMGVLQLAERASEGEIELQVMRIGNFVIVGLPGEIFVEFGLAIKAGVPSGRAAVVGLANGIIGYVPTREAYAQGGYETWPTPTSWSAPGTGEAMVESVMGHIQQRQS